jgi:hypothetical protein
MEEGNDLLQESVKHCFIACNDDFKPHTLSVAPRERKAIPVATAYEE